MKSKVALVVAIVLGFIAALGLRAHIVQIEQKAQGSKKTVKVLVAGRDIKAGEVIRNDMLGEDDADQNMIRDGRVILARELTNVVGRTIQRQVRAGTVLTWIHFEEGEEAADPAARTPAGYRQITIPVDKVTGCAGRLLPGTIVDVLVTLRVRRDPNAPIEPVTQTVLTGMRVVATDLHSRSVPGSFRSARQRRDYATYSTVTLRVQPLQANLLAFLADQGKLHLVIRGPADATGRDPSKIDKITLDNLDTLIRKAAVEKPPPASPSRPGGGGR